MVLDNTMALFTAPQTIEFKTGSVPDIPQGYICVKYLYCGICGGDHSIFLGRRRPYPISLGHEFVGEVVSLGNDVHGFQCRDIVISDFNYRCGICMYCKTGRSHLCVQNGVEFFSNRGFANYGVIHSNYLVRISPPAYLPRACLIEPLSCVIHACDYMRIQSGMQILLCGGGSLGMLFCFYLTRILGNVSIDIYEVVEARARLLEQRFSVSRFRNDLLKTYDVIIDCSNTISGLTFSLKHTPPGGNVCVLSHLYGLDTSFVYEQICKKELHCAFPLRNGKRGNLAIAAEYIECFWESEDDVLLSIHQSISQAFYAKASSPSCKQIVCCQGLLP